MLHGPAQIDVVTTPAESYNLVDLPTVKTLLNITDTSVDAYLNLVIPMASSMVADYCNQPFVVETIQSSYYPQRDGWPWVVRNEIAPLQLARYPLVEVISVTETVSGVVNPLVAGTDFLIDSKKGQLVRLAGNGYPRNWWPIPIVVSFQAGWETIPPSVFNATVTILKGMLAARNRDPNLRSENIEGVYEAQYWFGSGPGSSAGLPSSITGALDIYRMPVVG